jgi:hypothetical protein
LVLSAVFAQDAADSAIEILRNRTKWARLGRLAEIAAYAWLTGNGYVVLESQLYVKTEIGLRITDFLVIDPITGERFGIEVKANQADRTPVQRAKDEIIATRGGEVRSRDARYKPGSHIQYRTYVWCIDMGDGTLNCPVDQVPSPRPVP